MILHNGLVPVSVHKLTWPLWYPLMALPTAYASKLFISLTKRSNLSYFVKWATFLPIYTYFVFTLLINFSHISVTLCLETRNQRELPTIVFFDWVIVWRWVGAIKVHHRLTNQYVPKNILSCPPTPTSRKEQTDSLPKYHQEFSLVYK